MPHEYMIWIIYAWVAAISIVIWVSVKPWMADGETHPESDDALSDLPDVTEEQLKRMQTPTFPFLSIVEFDLSNSPEKNRRYPLREGRSFLFMGMLPDTPDHCVVFDYKTGQMYAGYHIDLFKKTDG